MSVETLEPELIVKTIKRLGQRIEERFPESSLKNVCRQVHLIAQNMQTRARWIGKPVAWLRILTWTVCAGIVALAIVPFYMLLNSDGSLEIGSEETSRFTDVVTLMEAGLNDIVLIGAAIFFLLTIETRYKRQRALKALHELRSIAHVIDMHQLTKDPHRIMANAEFSDTLQSPKVELSQFQLRRYLDYCSEILSLIGKIAAVYEQEFDDGVAMASAAELETLTTGLSRKIWQKIAILHTVQLEEVASKPRKIDSGESKTEE